MTDNNNKLDILGNTGDEVKFTGDGWQKAENAETDTNGKVFDVWTNTNDDTVRVRVENNISDGITN